MAYVFPAPSIPALPVAGTGELFPVRRVYCVGRNYAAHAREMGGDPTREPPFFFMKPADALQPVAQGETADHPYPPKTGNYHFEIEMVVALAKGGRDIPVEGALDHVFGYAVGLDMTRRDLQDEAKQLRRPLGAWKGGGSLGAGRPTLSGLPGWTPLRRHHLPVRRRRYETNGRPGGYDLVGRRADHLPVLLFRALPGRCDLLRHPGRGGRGGKGPDHGWGHRGFGRDPAAGCVRPARLPLPFL